MSENLAQEIAALTPQVRRYCARMLSSIFDGDDIAQETLATALAKQHLLRDDTPLKPWVFRIAHNKCIDLLRFQNRWQTETEEVDIEAQLPLRTDAALERLVICLPPRQRAMILLKEVFGLSLSEVSSSMMCSVDSVKSGLNRARNTLAKIATAQPQQEEKPMPNDSDFALIKRYAELFHLADWDGVLQMIHEEVQLDVATIYCGVGADKVLNRYCTNYCRFEFPWAANAVLLPSGPCILTWRMDGESPQLIGVVRVKVNENRIAGITDYLHDEDMMQLVAEELNHLKAEDYYPQQLPISGRQAPEPI